jgi:hypothetical protein
MQGWFVAHYDAFKDFAGPALTLLGFAITIGIAVAGFRTFDRWKKEKIEGKKIEVAFDALAMCYESKHIFENIRSPMSFDYEWKDMPKAAGESDVSWNRRGPFYAVGQGVRANKDFFNRVFTLQQHCMAAFGPEYEGIFMLLHKSRREIEVSSECLLGKLIIKTGLSWNTMRRSMNSAGGIYGMSVTFNARKIRLGRGWLNLEIGWRSCVDQ